MIHPIQKVPLFFMRWLNGWQRSAKFDMNLLIYAKNPCKPRSSLRFLGSGMSWMALTLAWSILMPRCRIIKPKNLPEVTPNAHLSGFILSWHFRNLSKICWRSRKGSGLFLDLTTRSSTKHSTVLYSMFSKIVCIALWYVAPAFFKQNGITL